MTCVHLTPTQWREIESDYEDELERIGNMRRADATYDVTEPPHPRQLSIYDALSAEDLRSYLGGRA
jgi:hypothetical protein